METSEVLKYGAIAIGLLSPLYAAAKATPDEHKRVRGWVLSGIWLTFVLLVISSCVYFIYTFVNADGLPTRHEIFNFACVAAVLAMYVSIIAHMLMKELSRKKRLEKQALMAEGERLKESILKHSVIADVFETLNNAHDGVKERPPVK